MMYTDDRLTIQQNINYLRERVRWHETVIEQTRQSIADLEQLDQTIAAEPEPAQPPLITTNVDAYEWIIRQAGHPMHVSEIAAEAQRIGVTWQGTAEPKTMVRNALLRAKGRFVNSGANHWNVISRQDNQ